MEDLKHFEYKILETQKKRKKTVITEKKLTERKVVMITKEQAAELNENPRTGGLFYELAKDEKK